MNLLIDASNLITGGGVSHLSQLMNSIDNELLIASDIDSITLIGIEGTLSRVRDNHRIRKIVMEGCDHSLLKRLVWKWKYLRKIIIHNNIDFIYNPGGSYTGKVPFVTMSRNMLVYENEEANRFGLSVHRFKLFILYYVQTYSLKKATGVIFISNYAKEYISKKIHLNGTDSLVIHHGSSIRFKMKPKDQLSICQYNSNQPFKILYVSTIDVYKHQLNVAKSIVRLRDFGYPIELTLIGSKERDFKKLDNYIEQFGLFIKYLGKISFEEIHKSYRDTDLFIFASTCENMPNILIEAMSAGLPIACSHKMPMPEFLKDGGIYFDPLNIDSICSAIEKLIKNPSLRKEVALKAYHYSEDFDWKKCCLETFSYISSTYKLSYKSTLKES